MQARANGLDPIVTGMTTYKTCQLSDEQDLLGEAARRLSGIGPGFLRLSVGLEAEQDLVADLKHALTACRIGKTRGEERMSLMPMTVIIVDLIGFLLVVLGFHLAFRQEFVRLWWGILRHGQLRSAPPPPLMEDDPARYILRISGMMILAFGIVISMLFTLANYSLQSAL